MRSASVLPVTVLLADPSDLTRLGLRALLESDARFAVVGDAPTGAVAASERLQPDLIILDRPVSESVGIIDLLRRTSPSSRLAFLTTTFDLHGYRALVRGDIRGYFLEDFAGQGIWLLAALMLIATAGALIAVPPVIEQPNALPWEAFDVQVPVPGVDRLTERERHVLALLLEGLSDQEVATGLSIALTTVETHVRNISLKLGARTRIHLGVLATRAGLHELPLGFPDDSLGNP